VGPNYERRHYGWLGSPVAPAVAGAVLHHGVARAEHLLGPIVQLEATWTMLLPFCASLSRPCIGGVVTAAARLLTVRVVTCATCPMRSAPGSRRSHECQQARRFLACSVLRT
jgi:hypothetical protein